MLYVNLSSTILQIGHSSECLKGQECKSCLGVEAGSRHILLLGEAWDVPISVGDDIGAVTWEGIGDSGGDLAVQHAPLQWEHPWLEEGVDVAFIPSAIA